MVFDRLLSMGWNHNRYHVRDVLASILYEMKDLGLAKLALDAMRRNIGPTRWASAAISIDRIHPLLREGLREINNPSPEEEEITF